MNVNTVFYLTECIQNTIISTYQWKRIINGLFYFFFFFSILSLRNLVCILHREHISVGLAAFQALTRRTRSTAAALAARVRAWFPAPVSSPDRSSQLGTGVFPPTQRLHSEV